MADDFKRTSAISFFLKSGTKIRSISSKELIERNMAISFTPAKKTIYKIEKLIEKLLLSLLKPN